MATEPATQDGRLKAQIGTASAAAIDFRDTESRDSNAEAEIAILWRSSPKGSAPGRLRTMLPGLLIGVADLLALAAAWCFGLFIAGHFHFPVVRIPSFHAAGYLAIFLAFYLASGLYPGIVVHPADELRRQSVGTSLASIVLLLLAATTRKSSLLLGAVPVVWALALASMPLGRLLMRRVCARRPWWGMPALILGASEIGIYIAGLLRRHPALGLKPVGFLDDQPDRCGENGKLGSAPYLGPLCNAGLAARAYGARHAIVAMPHLAAEDLACIIRRHAQCFPHLLVIPDLLGTANLGVQPRNLGGLLGLEITQHLAQRFPQLLKRCVDVVLAPIGLIIVSPLFLFLYIAVRLESAGPVFYSQDRIGREGNAFKVWKIRSMYCDGEQRLHRACRVNPALAAEWKQDQKLREDPRVTPIGRRLRQLSLDELPQLWNVLRGDMSLVGPRPIVRAEVHRYEDRFASYALVRPGITGLWQVSGRNNTSYRERVAFDEYYVRNWSVWLDLYILARTIRTVLTCEGAY
jgi:Undecaprenyl-phosphate galactose phosphotransferase WbaP